MSGGVFTNGLRYEIDLHKADLAGKSILGPNPLGISKWKRLKPESEDAIYTDNGWSLPCRYTYHGWTGTFEINANFAANNVNTPYFQRHPAEWAARNQRLGLDANGQHTTNQGTPIPLPDPNATPAPGYTGPNPILPTWFPPSAGEINGLSGASRTRQEVACATSSIPVVYGRDRVEGSLGFVGVDDTNGVLYLAVIFCTASNAIEKLYVDGIEVDLAVNGLVAKGGAYEKFPVGGLSSMLSTLVPGYTDSPNTCYAVLKVPKTYSRSFPKIEAIIKGKEVYDPRGPTTAWSDNPVLAMADLATEAGWGVNWTSAALGADFCDEVLGGKPRRRIGLTLAEPKPAEEWAKVFRVYTGCFHVWESGKLRFIPDKAETLPAGLARTFTQDDILQKSIKLKRRSPVSLPTTVIVEYRDNQDDENWTTARAISEDTDATIARVSRVSLPGIHDYERAFREADERRKKFAADLVTEITVFDEGLELQAGSIIRIIHPIGLDEYFRVTNLTNDQGRWTLQLMQYDASAYSDATPSPPVGYVSVLGDPTSPATGVGVGLSAPEITNLIENTGFTINVTNTYPTVGQTPYTVKMVNDLEGMYNYVSLLYADGMVSDNEWGSVRFIMEVGTDSIREVVAELYPNNRVETWRDLQVGNSDGGVNTVSFVAPDASKAFYETDVDLPRPEMHDVFFNSAPYPSRIQLDGNETSNPYWQDPVGWEQYDNASSWGSFSSIFGIIGQSESTPRDGWDHPEWLPNAFDCFAIEGWFFLFETNAAGQGDYFIWGMSGPDITRTTEGYYELRKEGEYLIFYWYGEDIIGDGPIAHEVRTNIGTAPGDFVYGGNWVHVGVFRDGTGYVRLQVTSPGGATLIEADHAVYSPCWMGVMDVGSKFTIGSQLRSDIDPDAPSVPLPKFKVANMRFTARAMRNGSESYAWKVQGRARQEVRFWFDGTHTFSDQFGHYYVFDRPTTTQKEAITQASLSRIPPRMWRYYNLEYLNFGYGNAPNGDAYHEDTKQLEHLRICMPVSIDAELFSLGWGQLHYYNYLQYGATDTTLSFNWNHIDPGVNSGYGDINIPGVARGGGELETRLTFEPLAAAPTWSYFNSENRDENYNDANYNPNRILMQWDHYTWTESGAYADRVWERTQVLQLRKEGLFYNSVVSKSPDYFDPVWTRLATIDDLGGGSLEYRPPITNSTDTTYTLALADRYVRLDSASAISCTVPLHATIPYAVGQRIEVLQVGAGQITLVPWSGVTLNTPTSLVSAEQFGTIWLRYVGSDTWDVGGDLV